MPKLFKRRSLEPIEMLLVEHRAEPRDEFARSLLSSLGTAPARSKLRVGSRATALRLAAAACLTALALVGATAAAGGVGAASHGLVHIANIKHTLGLETKHKALRATRAGKTVNPVRYSSDGPSAHQYAVTICHATASKTNPYVQLTLSPQGAAEHLAHHSGDFIAPPNGCPGAKQHH